MALPAEAAPRGKPRSERLTSVPLEMPNREKRPSPSDEKRTEADRRATIGRIQQQATQLDHLFFQIPKPANALANQLDAFRGHEALAFGEETRLFHLGAVTTADQGPKRKTHDVAMSLLIDHGKEYPAYSRFAGGETTYAYRDSEKTYWRIQRFWNPITKSFDEEPERLVGSDIDYVALKTRQRYFASTKGSIAETYGITPEEVPLSLEQMSARMSVPAGTEFLRGYAVAGLDDLLGLNVVPISILRAEEDNADIRLVQASVKGEMPGIAAEMIDSATLESILELGPRHPGAQSFMRLATLDYLVRSLDRAGNIMFDPVTGTFSGIDNGLSLGLSEQKKTSDTRVNISSVQTVAADQIVSIPLEVVWQHQDWQLDQEALEQMTRVYNACIRHLEERETPQAERRITGEHDALSYYLQETGGAETNGQEMKYLSRLFQLVFDDKRIAKKELLEFFVRLKRMIDLKRPPQLDTGEYLPKLDSERQGLAAQEAKK